MSQEQYGGGDPSDTTCHGSCGIKPPDTCTICTPVQSKDTSAIIGSKGYNPTLKWVSVKDNLPYKILFENDSDLATALAQKVIVYLPIHPMHIDTVWGISRVFLANTRT